MNSLTLVVFDWAGTLIDLGSKAPLQTFIDIFADEGIAVPEAVAKGPMGLGKRDHINQILQDPSIQLGWEKQFGKPSTSQDVDRLYKAYEPKQIQAIKQFSQLISGAQETVSWLRAKGIKVAGTTGYPRSVASVVWKEAKNQGLELDANACNCDVLHGRPGPFMLFKVMELTNSYPSSAVIKVGDTVPDVLEGRNAGVRTVSVVSTGAGWEGEASRERLEFNFKQARTNYLIDSVSDLPKLLEEMKLV